MGIKFKGIQELNSTENLGENHILPISDGTDSNEPTKVSLKEIKELVTPSLYDVVKKGDTTDQAIYIARATQNGHAVNLEQLNQGLEGKQETAEKAQANGYASLDEDGKVPLEQLPAIDAELFVVVTELPVAPDEGNENKIHLVPSLDTEQNNRYTEYLWKTDTASWEKFGEIDHNINIGNSDLEVTGLSTGETRTLKAKNRSIAIESDYGGVLSSLNLQNGEALLETRTTDRRYSISAHYYGGIKIKGELLSPEGFPEKQSGIEVSPGKLELYSNFLPSQWGNPRIVLDDKTISFSEKIRISDVDKKFLSTDESGLLEYLTPDEVKVKLTLGNVDNTSDVTVLANALTQTKAEIDKIEIGGTNLITGSKDYVGWGYNNNPEIIPNAYKDFTAYRRVGSYGSRIYSGFIAYAGDTITVSFFAKYVNNVGRIVIFMDGNNLQFNVGFPANAIVDKWYKLSRIITVDVDVSSLKIEEGSEYVGVEFCAIKVELGNKATDWSPAPEEYLKLSGGTLNGILKSTVATKPTSNSYNTAGIVNVITDAEHNAGNRPGFAFHSSNHLGTFLYADTVTTLKKVDVSGRVTTLWDSGNLPYEEGVWTPSVMGGTNVGTPVYSIRWGMYKRIGNTVIVSFHIMGTWSSLPTGRMSITGLPFNAQLGKPFNAQLLSADYSVGKIMIFALNSSLESHVITDSLTSDAQPTIFGVELSNTNFNLHGTLTYFIQ